jgi:hypothetical protein
MCARAWIGLVGSVGFDAGDRVVGGAANGVWSVVAVGGQVGVSDVDGDGLTGVDTAEGEFLPGDHDDAGGGDASLDGDRFGGWLGWWSGGAGGA